MRTRRAAINTVSFFAFQDIITSVVGIFVLITLIMILELVQTKIGSAGQHASVSAIQLKQLEELEQEVAKLATVQSNLQAKAHKAATNNAFTLEEELSSLNRQQQEIDDELKAAIRRTSKLEEQLRNAESNEKQLMAKEKELASKFADSESLAEEQKAAAKVIAVLEIEKPLIFRDQTEQGRNLVLVVLEKQAIIASDAQSGRNQTFAGASRERDFRTWLADIDLKTRQFLLITKPSGAGDFEKVRKSLSAANAIYGFDVAGEDQKFRLRSQLRGL